MNPAKLTLIGAALLPWASLLIASLFMPRLTRPDLFFAVTVNPAFRNSAEARGILRHYYRSIILVAVLALPLMGLIHLGRPKLVLAGLLGPVLVELAGWLGAFLVARGRTIPYHVEPTTQREAAVQPRRVSMPGGWFAQLGPFLILAAIFLCLWLRWNNIPRRIPIHWGIGGKPDGWAAKSPASVFGGAAIGLLVCALLASLCYGILHGVRRIHGSGPRAIQEARFTRAISFSLLGLEYWLALLMGLLSLAALRPNPTAPLRALWLILPGQILVIGAILLVAFRAGQGGWRWSKGAEAAGSAPVGDRTPDECWKMGLFYFNRNDPAVFVEKRFGIGWTLNFANPRAMIVMGAILLFMVAVLSISLLSRK